MHSLPKRDMLIEFIFLNFDYVRWVGVNPKNFDSLIPRQVSNLIRRFQIGLI